MTFFGGVTRFLTKRILREKGFILVYSWRGLLQHGGGGVAAGREGMHDRESWLVILQLQLESRERPENRAGL